MKAFDDRINLSVRLPRHVRDWLAEQARENGSSINSELVRAAREKMTRARADFGAQKEASA